MKNWRSLMRWLFVTGGIVVLTSLSVDAALSPKGISQSALAILASSVVPKKECPSGMARVQYDMHSVCVDQFEASPSQNCEQQHVLAPLDTRTNSDARACMSDSRASAYPWTFVTFHQAKELCAKAGKRLLTNREWYEAVVGTPDEKENSSCNVDGTTVEMTGTHQNCVTTLGVHDGIGNVWEWVDASVHDGVFAGSALPRSGYVTTADESGVARSTDENIASDAYHNDYFWSEKSGDFGMLRGGFFASGKDAGMYSIQAKTPLSQAGNAIGFRCALDI